MWGDNRNRPPCEGRGILADKKDKQMGEREIHTATYQQTKGEKESWTSRADEGHI